MGFWLLIPFFAIRFGLLALLDAGSVRRAAHFAPLARREQPAYWVYQTANVALVVCLCFLRILPMALGMFYAGVALYVLGSLLLALSIVSFASPSENGFNQKGVYRVSRNPMYVSYFLVFLGCALLTRSLVLLLLLLAFQVSAHWVILAEERWCARQFGEAYLQYKKQVRRYL